MKEKYIRHLSVTERYWLAADLINPTYANQFVVEGLGNLDESLWEKAVIEAGKVHHGSRLILKGCLNSLRWVDSGVSPRLRIEDGSKWDGSGPEGAPFLKDPLSPQKGPTCEVILLKGDPTRIIFRTLHAVMDGRGTQLWASDIFRALRNEPLTGSDPSLNDVDIAAAMNIEQSPDNMMSKRPTDCIPAAGPADGNADGTTWKRIRIKGRFSLLLPQVAVLIAREARRHGEGNVVIDVPVDLRSRMPSLNSTSNLSGLIYFDVKPDSTPESIQSIIKSQIEEKKELTQYYPKWLNYIPISVLKGFGESFKRNAWNISDAHNCVPRPSMTA